MVELTGLGAFDWVVVGVHGLGIVLVLSGWFRRGAAGARRKTPVLAALAGSALVVTTAVLEPSLSGEAVIEAVQRPAALAGLLGVAVVAVAVVDFAFDRFPQLVTWAGRGAVGRDAGALASVALLSLAAVAAVVLLDTRLGSAFEQTAAETPTADAPPAAPAGETDGDTDSDEYRLAATFDLPGSPTGLALVSATEGYLALAQGDVVRFAITDGAEPTIEFETVASGLAFPRGLALVEETLVVADVGPLPCPEPPPAQCKGENVPGEGTVEERELRILNESRGRVSAYEVAADGTLGAERVLIDELPVANSEHGVNGVAAGPDGRAYLAIGNVDRVKNQRALLDRIDHPNADLLGTVVRVDPETGDFEVVAEGLRNVYEPALDSNGELWGVDNDGSTFNGWRREEVLHIEEGEHYGFPIDGTFPPYEVRTDAPLWVLGPEVAGSAGAHWVPGDRADRGTLLIGSCGGLWRLPVRQIGEAWRVGSDADFASVMSDVDGCVTGIEATTDGEVFAAAFGADELHVLEPTG